MEQRSGFPLSSLFLLIAFCALMMLLVTTVIQWAPDGTRLGKDQTVAIILGMLCGIPLGALFGSLTHRQVAGVSCGAFVGLLMGPIVATMLLATVDALRWLILYASVGALFLVGLAGMFRWLSRRSERRHDEIALWETPRENDRPSS